MSIIFKALPIDGPLRITSGYGPRNTGIAGASTYHRGNDLGAVRSRYKGSTDGGPIFAVMAGMVVSSYKNNLRGWVVLIDHGHVEGCNVKTLYQHLKGQGLGAGTKVKAGDKIATMGNTGVGAQLHLHFELRINNCCVNPQKYLEEVEDMIDEKRIREIIREELAGSGHPVSDWAKPFWAEMTTAGIVDGTNPQGVVTREQAATMIAKVRAGK